ncbi:hypothetical protein C5167_016850 [Papaver somniferum]|uniref:Uncharacterized protein n=1 Tax=Papaver somniferum TaxID=3469 RepID=A0A4Y7IL15_PAPSO|nr:hypothetical protein C5167_016850 [Papaver somniferum]
MTTRVSKAQKMVQLRKRGMLVSSRYWICLGSKLDYSQCFGDSTAASKAMELQKSLSDRWTSCNCDTNLFIISLKASSAAAQRY